MRRRHVVIGMSDRGFIAPVSRHWSQRAAESARASYARMAPPWASFHVATRS